MPSVNKLPLSHRRKETPVFNNLELLWNRRLQQNRLQQSRSAQQQRITVEPPEEGEARLQQLRTAQQQRIAAESTEEREARQHRDIYRQYYTQIPALQPSQLQEPHILCKMKQFLSKLANLQVGRSSLV